MPETILSYFEAVFIEILLNFYSPCGNIDVLAMLTSRETIIIKSK